MRRLAWFTAGFAAVCLLGSYRLGMSLVPPLAAALLLLFLLTWLGTRPRAGECAALLRPGPGMRGRLSRGGLYQAARRGCALCLGCLLAFCWVEAYGALFYAPAQALAGEERAVSGMVLSYPEETSIGGWSVTLRMDGGLRAPDILMYGDESWGGLRPGDRISCTARLREANRLRGEETTYYTARGVYLLGYCNESPETEPRGGLPVRCWPAVAARRLHQGLYTALDAVTAPLAAAVTLGDKDGLGEQTYSALSRSGVMHVAVVSGLHITFFVEMILRLCGRRRRVALALVPVLIFYALMAGGTPSAFRAVIMQGALLAAPVMRRENDPPTSLSLALLVLLLQNPFAAASVSLQMSFASVAGILLVCRPLSRWMCRPAEILEAREGRLWKGAGKAWRFAAATAATSLAAMVFTVPVTAFYFGQIALISPVTNILTLWCASALMVAALAVGILDILFPPVALAVGVLVNGLGHYFSWVTAGLGALPYASLGAEYVYIQICLAAAYLYLLGLLLFPGRKGWKGLLPVGCLGGLLALAIGLNGLSLSGAEMTVGVLNVGQGASTAFLTGEYTALVDCGGNQSRSAGDIAADYFAAAGRNKLDVLVLTHLDDDHFNGTAQLFFRMEVERVLVPDVGEHSPEAMGALAALVHAEGASLELVTRKEQYGLGSAQLTVYPPLGQGTSNEEGLFVLATAGSFDALITGDADSFVERMLVRYYDLPDIELLMVGHHGSKYSTCQELLDGLRPELAVISSGYNAYGHPAQETLERLTQAGTEVFRTDALGTVTFTVSGGQASIH